MISHQGFRADDAWEVDILNLQGQVVHQQSGLGNGILDVSNIPAGIYAVQLKQSDSVVKVLRFLKD